MKFGKHPGRTRCRLAELLAEKGIIVSPYDLWTQEGGYRSFYWDLARWGTNDAKFKDEKAPDGTAWHGNVILSSWSCMWECVKWGIEIGKDEPFGMWNHVSVEHARKPGE